MNAIEKDPGLSVLDEVSSAFRSIAENQVRMDRGLIWEFGGISQTITAEEPVEDNGETICRVHAETTFLSDLPRPVEKSSMIGFLLGQTWMSGMLVKEDPRSLVLRSIVTAGSGNRGWIGSVFTAAIASQAIDTYRLSPIFSRRVGGTPGNPLPISDCLHGPEFMRFKPTRLFTHRTNTDSSPWSRNVVLELIRDEIGEDSYITTIDDTRLTAEFPFGRHPGPSLRGGESILLEVLWGQGQRGHPYSMPGLSVSLTLPFRLDDEGTQEVAMNLNILEQDPTPQGSFLGSWSPDPFHNARFWSHIPGHCFAPGQLSALANSIVRRASWVDYLLVAHLR